MISGLIGAIGCFNLMISTINDFPYVDGKIEHVFSMYPLKIRIENNRKSYKIYGKKLSQTLKNMQIKGKNAKIWYNKNNRIVQLIIDGKVVIPFSNSILISIILILFGLFLFVGNLIYIINFKKYKKIYYEKIREKKLKKTNKTNAHN
jgi:hypothetical protein